MVTDADRPQFQAWLRNSLSPMMQQLGYAGRPSDTPEQKQKRSILFRTLGNIGEDPAVIQQASTLVQQYIKDAASVDPTLAGAVVVVAARHGDAQLYEQYKTQLQKVKSPQEYYRFFYGLAEFPQQALLKQTLASTLTPEVRGQDLYILISLLANPTSQNATWDFMRQNFDALMNKTGGGLDGVGVFLEGARTFCTPEKANELKQFFDQHPFRGTERNQKEAIESINSCVELGGQQQSKLAAWLKQNGKMNASTGGGSTGWGSELKRLVPVPRFGCLVGADLGTDKRPLGPQGACFQALRQVGLPPIDAEGIVIIARWVFAILVIVGGACRLSASGLTSGVKRGRLAVTTRNPCRSLRRPKKARPDLGMRLSPSTPPRPEG